MQLLGNASFAMSQVILWMQEESACIATNLRIISWWMEFAAIAQRRITSQKMGYACSARRMQTTTWWVDYVCTVVLRDVWSVLMETVPNVIKD